MTMKLKYNYVGNNTNSSFNNRVTVIIFICQYSGNIFEQSQVYNYLNYFRQLIGAMRTLQK